MKFKMLLQKGIDPIVCIGLHLYHLLVKVAHSVDFFLLITHSSSGQIVSRCYAYSLHFKLRYDNPNPFLIKNEGGVSLCVWCFWSKIALLNILVGS